MKRLLLLLIPIFAVFTWLAMHRSAPPEVPFTRVMRQTIESTLNTNGKVEPIEWTAIRAESGGPVEKVHVERAQRVAKGQLIIELDAAGARTELTTAQAKIAEARGQLDVLTAGGRASDQAEIESSLASARAELATAQREHETLQRLAQKKAATASEVTAAHEAAQKIELRIQALERRRGSLVSQPDRTIAEARIREAQSGAAEASRRIELSQIRSPMSGVLYQFDLKRGAYLNAGDLVGSVGRLNQMRVVVYVDEPELGRVEKGMPVSITWDALPGRQWKGSVERIPTQIVPLGTRQVGEVSCIIENPDGTLVPGTNINAEIQSRVVKDAITIPKETLRREGNDTGVFKLEGGFVKWQRIKLGAASVTRTQVLEGLSESDAVALPVERPLKSGDRVTPVFP
ncbi:MAG TPA: efflux RND transporter periplasmic adaptor subunit [Bryobacteraceae bacterium]|nr:efflux RND transporter periplasmic adaptor subunit [Bryobacteraceae bacterium]